MAKPLLSLRPRPQASSADATSAYCLEKPVALRFTCRRVPVWTMSLLGRAFTIHGPNQVSFVHCFICILSSTCRSPSQIFTGLVAFVSTCCCHVAHAQNILVLIQVGCTSSKSTDYCYCLHEYISFRVSMMHLSIESDVCF